MDKRYQVFVSSTYADLKEERRHVIQALMEMDCIPAGMELFPAADEEQWKFIKGIIDDCDYYLIIIGGCYGSITNDGISYTEKEFDYAVKSGLKVVALIHSDIDKIPLGKSEKDPELRVKLSSFRDKVKTGRLVKSWKSTEELPGLVALSLTKTIKMYPAIGWVRSSHVANEDILVELNELRKQNAELQKSVYQMSKQQRPAIDDIADIDSTFTIHGTDKYSYGPGYSTQTRKFKDSISWRELFSRISPYLAEHPNDNLVSQKIASAVYDKGNRSGYSPSIDDQDFKTITIQLKAYGLVTTEYLKTVSGSMALFWSLTDKGEQLMIESRVIRKST